MSTAAKPEIDYLTKCRVPGCGKQFKSSPFEATIIGAPDDRIVKFVNALMTHASQHHPEQMTQISGSIQQFMGWIITAMFEIQDPRLLDMQEQIRAVMQKMTRRVNVTDADILDRVARLELSTAQEEGVNFLIRDLRDLLTEQGNYAPAIPPTEKPLIVA